MNTYFVLREEFIKLKRRVGGLGKRLRLLEENPKVKQVADDEAAINSLSNGEYRIFETVDGIKGFGKTANGVVYTIAWAEN